MDKMNRIKMSFVAPNYCYTIKSIKIKTELQTVLSFGSVRTKMAKNDHVDEARKVRRSDATSIKLSLVIYCDLKT